TKRLHYLSARAHSGWIIHVLMVGGLGTEKAWSWGRAIIDAKVRRTDAGCKLRYVPQATEEDRGAHPFKGTGRNWRAGVDPIYGENVTIPHKEETAICEFCRKGHNIQHLEDIAFRQWSDIGWISCRVAVSIDVCNVCNARTLPGGGDKILEEALQREVAKRRIRRGVGQPA